MSAGSAPSVRCGGLDRLDRRWSSGCLSGRVSRGWDRAAGHRACRDVRGVGFQPWLRWSRQARPAVVERVPVRPGESGLGPGRRSSSLSRCPRVGSQRSVRWSRQARPAGSSGCLSGRVSRGWVRAAAHRACRDVRGVGFQRSLRWSRRARPAVVERVPSGRVSRGWDRATAHRACRDVRRVGSQRARAVVSTGSTGGGRAGARPAVASKPGCGGLDRLDRRGFRGCLRCGWVETGAGAPVSTTVDVSQRRPVSRPPRTGRPGGRPGPGRR